MPLVVRNILCVKMLTNPISNFNYQDLAEKFPPALRQMLCIFILSAHWFDKLIYIWRNGINKSPTKFHFYANFAAVKRYYIAWRRSFSRMPSHILFKWLWRYTLEVYNFYEAGIEPLLCTAFQRALIECSRRKRCYTTFTFRHFRGQRLATLNSEIMPIMLRTANNALAKM